MPTVNGKLVFDTDPTDQFKAVFVIDGNEIILVGTIIPAMELFRSSSPLTATLTYDNPGELTDSHSYTGRIGTDTYEFTFENGPTIHGTFPNPVYPDNPTALSCFGISAGYWSGDTNSRIVFYPCHSLWPKRELLMGACYSINRRNAGYY
ncbi:hypothetical protein B0I37DRAFT_401615 [Chaetomium sp. MPI-CAGE-AT-0009]|nr:hypothetical protein B0I37DRAFT_401615 [Chaetomium sp. MPI-CAGE-AT-0009]